LDKQYNSFEKAKEKARSNESIAYSKLALTKRKGIVMTFPESHPLALRHPQESKVARKDRPQLDTKDWPEDLKRFIVELDQSDAEWERIKKNNKATIIIAPQPKVESQKQRQTPPATTSNDWVIVPRPQETALLLPDIFRQIRLVSNAFNNLLKK